MNFHLKKGKVKISTKVALSFIIIVLFQGILTQIGMYFLIFQSNINSFREQMAVTMEGVDTFLSQRQDDLDNKVKLLSGQKNIIEFTDFRLRNLLRRELSLFNQVLDLNGIYIFVDDGEIFVEDSTSRDLPDSRLLDQVADVYRNGPQRFLYDDGEGMFLWSLGQIIRENNVIGMIGARVAIDAEFVDVLEKNTNSVTMIEFPARFIYSDRIDEKKWERLKEASASMASGEIKIAGDYMVGVARLESFASADGKQFCVLDMQKLRQSLRDYNRFAVILTIMVLTVALVLSILFYRQSFLRPYNALQEGVARIGNGDFSYPIQQTSGDEFGALVRSVNQMRINLLNRDRELSALANYNELILNNVRSGIITVGHDGMVNTCNAAAANLVHLDETSALPLHLETAKLPDEVKELINRGISNEDYVALKECVLMYDGREEILTVSTSPFSNGEGEELGLIAVIADVTQIKKLESQLKVSERLAAIGEMVAGVAHQIRNPLAIMKVSAEILRDNFGKNIKENAKHFDELTTMLVSEIDSLNYIIHNFLNFARPLHINYTLCDIREIIEGAVSLLPFDKHPELQLKIEIDPDIPFQKLDKNLMEQVIRNLVQNAMEASESGDIILKAFMEEGLLKIKVQDSGCGMDKETLQNAFNPFFTLKNKGTGLGLSIVHRIIQEHSGTISIDSAPGKGSSFTVTI